MLQRDEAWANLRSSPGSIGAMYGTIFACVLWFTGLPVIWGLPMGVFVSLAMAVGRHLDQILTAPRARRLAWGLFLFVAQTGALTIGRLVRGAVLNLPELGFILAISCFLVPLSYLDHRDRLAEFRPRRRADR